MNEEIGRVKLSDTVDIVVKKTEFRGEERIDIRKYIKTKRYTGWSQQGISVPVRIWKELYTILEKITV